MPSVGPELPHYLKRKRSLDDEGSPTVPTRMIIAGPTLPSPQNPDELALGSSSEDEDFGPSAPNCSSPQTKGAPEPPRILGPAPPPAPLSERPTVVNDASDSEDDDYGPSLPPPPGSSAAKSLLTQQEADQARLAYSEPASKPQRAEWMLVPPTSSDWTSRIDPTKLKSRKFASAKGGGTAAAAGKGMGEGGISAIWTETPEEKRKRVEDEVLGRKEVYTTVGNGGVNSGRGRDGKQQEKDRRISEYNEKVRGRSLIEVHLEGKGTKEEDDDPSKRDFDREKDMALGGRVGHMEKREMLNKAKDFGVRFQKGNYL